MTEDEIRSLPLDSLELPIRAFNCLRREGVTSVGGLIDLIEQPARFAAMRSFGIRSFHEMRAALDRVGVTVSGDPLRDGKEINRKAAKPYREPGTSVYLTKNQIEWLLGCELDNDALASKLESALPKVC